MEYNESQKQNLKRSYIDWTQTKVLFIAPSFTEFQITSSRFKDLPIELWECKRYEKEIIVINPIKKPSSAPRISQVQGKLDSDINRVTKHVKVYNEEDHLDGKSDEIKELYEAFKK